MERFLIINPFGIGDVLFTTPVIRGIKENKPDSFIGYWCNQRAGELLKSNRMIDKIFPLSRGDIKKAYAASKLNGLRKTLGLFFQIKKESFGVSLDYSLDHRYGLLSRLAGIKKRIGFNYKNRGRFLTDKLELEGYNDKHAAEYYLDLLKFIGIAPVNRDLELAVSAQDKERAKKELAAYGVKEGELLIGIVPAGGESWGRDYYLKHWPVENFARLADGVIEKFAARILILGSDNEMAVADSLIDKMSNKPVNLTGKTDLPGLTAVIDNLEILVANDGGPLHIAAALGKKTVSFFGPSDPLVYGPYPSDAARCVVLRKKLECSPCYRNFRLSGCSRNKQCLRDISVDEALEAVSGLLLKEEKK